MGLTRGFLTTSRLRRTPPKNYCVIFKRRVTALIGSIVPTIHCVAGGELGLTRGLNRTTRTTKTTKTTRTTEATRTTRGNGLIADTARCVIMYIITLNY